MQNICVANSCKGWKGNFVGKAAMLIFVGFLINEAEGTLVVFQDQDFSV